MTFRLGAELSVRLPSADVAAGNLLVADGHLSAVIDFGTCGVGDPACDSWSHGPCSTTSPVTPSVPRWVSRRGTWARGWALWKALITAADGTDEAATIAALRTIEGVVEDHLRRRAG